MEIKKRKDKLIVSFDDKVVTLRGHQDRGYFTVFTESVATHPSLSDSDREKLKEELKRREDIVIS